MTVTPAQQDRARGCLLGLAIGDALGATLEFAARDSRPMVRDLIGGGPFGLEPGQWSDDTSMALCLADSLIACRDLDTRDLMQRFLRWYRHGENSCTGTCFDIGNTTRNALARFESTGKLAGDGIVDEHQAGNGSLMRVAPVALFAAPDANRAACLAALQSRTTHAALAAHEACAYFATLLVEAIAGAAKADVLRSRTIAGQPDVAAVAAGCWRHKERDEISSSGYVVHTLEAALWCVDQTDSFEDAVTLAANLADDADTVAAVTGQLAGAWWGYPAIPERWRARVVWADHIELTAKQLVLTGREAPGCSS